MTKRMRHSSGLVYSTDPNVPLVEVPEIQPTLPAEQQRLAVRLDARQRKGKVVTVVEGFIGTSQDMEALGKTLKSKAGAGGSVKDGLILIQGDFKQLIINELRLKGYQVKPG